MRKILIMTMLVLMSQSSFAMVTVGSSPGFGVCDFTTISDALLSNDPEIRVLSNQVFQENLFIDRQVDIKGGYHNCESADIDQPSGNITQIDASQSPGLPAIRIDNTGSSTGIRLYRLALTNASDSGIGAGSALNMFTTNGLVELFYVSIYNNIANDGAGIVARNGGGTLRVILNNTKVFNNTSSSQGGGIYCSHPDTFIIVQNDSGIYDNNALFGGGIAATNGCEVTVSSGDDAMQGTTFSGVVRNTALNSGGGVFANNGAKIYFQGNRYAFGLLGNSNKPATLAENEAGSNGGGVAAYNDSEIEMYDTLVWKNKADVNGGAFHLETHSSLLMTTSDNSSCWKQDMCSILAFNNADLGGAIYQSKGSTAIFNNSHIYKNGANWGLVIFSREDGESGTDTKFHNNMIYGHGNNAFDRGDRYLFRGYEPVTMELIHNTITENDVDDSRSILGAAVGASFTIKNSIVWNPGETVYSEDSNSNNDIDADCLMVNERSSFSGNSIAQADPNFVDPSNDDFHLANNSNAVDLCASISGFTHDIDGEERGFNDPIQNLNGSFDVGADETYASDVIFKHGFE